MGKTQLIKVDGTIVDDLSNCKYRVVLENGKEITAYISGKLRMNNIRLLVGDAVTVEISPYDLNNGRIIFRKKAVTNNQQSVD